jgi:hypothetical protein
LAADFDKEYEKNNKTAINGQKREINFRWKNNFRVKKISAEKKFLQKKISTEK